MHDNINRKVAEEEEEEQVRLTVLDSTLFVHSSLGRVWSLAFAAQGGAVRPFPMKQVMDGSLHSGSLKRTSSN